MTKLFLAFAAVRSGITLFPMNRHLNEKLIKGKYIPVTGR
jgi:hypothetical protein